MNVSIEREGCIGCGLCTTVCPEIFQLGEDGLAMICTDPSAANEETVRSAAEQCPVRVIHVE